MKKFLIPLLCSIALPAQASIDPTLNQVSSPVYTEHITEDQRQSLCLSLNIYHEARGSTRQDQVAVAWVTKNRVATSGRTYCRVIWAPGQFTWTRRSPSSLRPREMAAWHRAVRVSQQVMRDEVADPTNGANSFRVKRLSIPRAARNAIVIGAHIFYRVPGL